jgi:hypothetical protein
MDPTIDICTECLVDPAAPGSDWCRWCIREAQELDRYEQQHDER